MFIQVLSNIKGCVCFVEVATRRNIWGRILSNIRQYPARGLASPSLWENVSNPAQMSEALVLSKVEVNDVLCLFC